MKNGILTLLFCMFLFPSAANSARKANNPNITKKAKSLDGIEEFPLTEEGQGHWDDQMHGIDVADGLGKTLPKVLSKAQIVQCTMGSAAPSDMSNMEVGAVALPQKDLWATIVMPREKAYEERRLDLGEERRFYRLGVMKLADGKVECVAKMPTSVELKDVDGISLKVDRFDKANFKLNQNDSAVALRLVYNVGYSGGGAMCEELRAYRISGKDLSQVLATPMYCFINLAGDWNDDGTREHDYTQEKAILHVEKKMTKGVFNWRKSVKGRRPQVFKWNGSTFISKDKEPLAGFQDHFAWRL